jgi:excisionase family DNA binding protein
MPESILTILEVAEMLKVSDKTVYSMAKQGVIPAFKVGNQWRFRKGDIENWMQDQIDDNSKKGKP